MFISDLVWDMLVDMTNRNAARKRLTGHDKGLWLPVTRPEMRAFVGLTIVTGIVRMPTLAMYWASSNTMCQLPSFSATMPRDRFLQIMRYLHVNDEAAGNPDDDKLYKVRDFINLINNNFGAKYTMGCQISIDESLIPFKGRLSFRQFIPSKRARFGIKCWVLADALNSFVSRFCVYTGRDANAVPAVPLSTRVVRELLRDHENLHHHLYVDNFYTSTDLFKWLLENGVYACGTVRKGRVGFPKDLYFARGRHVRGTSSYLTSGNLLAQSWYDSKEVYFLSTIHPAEYPADTPDADRTVRRRSPNGTIDVAAPPLLHDYNHYMGGVNLADIIIKHYSIGQKTFRAYRRILFYAIELCVHNAYIMEGFVVPHDTAGRRKRGTLQFRMELAEQLVAPHRAAATHRQVGRPRLADDDRLTNVGQHFPVHKPGKEHNKDCRVC
ncbi:PiggyBac transposable element-derived protein 4, partial [Lamellibrachia satsuma]